MVKCSEVKCLDRSHSDVWVAFAELGNDSQDVPGASARQTPKIGKKPPVVAVNSRRLT